MSREVESGLKLCPFCGGKAKVIKQNHREYKPTYYVRCTSFSCRVETPQKQSETEAIAIWNRRNKE